MQTQPEPTTTIETLLEPDALASLFGVSKQTIRRWWQAGVFPAPLRVGRRSIRWRLSEIRTFIERNNSNASNTRISPSGNAASVSR
jgi:predicted DNA-binding transcriptional regulator AlpA